MIWSGSLRGFSGSEQWIAWLCPNGFGGSIFMDWVAPPPWNTHASNQLNLLLRYLLQISVQFEIFFWILYQIINFCSASFIHCYLPPTFLPLLLHIDNFEQLYQTLFEYKISNLCILLLLVHDANFQLQLKF